MKKMNFLSISILTVLAFVTTISLSSCDKDDPQTTTYSVRGLWIGTFKNTTTPPQAFAVSIKPDGTTTYENTISGTRQFCAGTWTLTGSTLTCNFTCIYGLPGNVGVQQTYTATFNPADGTLSAGQWVNTAPPAAANSGTFELTKVE